MLTPMRSALLLDLSVHLFLLFSRVYLVLQSLCGVLYFLNNAILLTGFA